MPIQQTQGLVAVSVVHQDITVTNPAGATTFTLDPSLQWNAVTPNHFSLAGNNAVRVYINDIRQYGNYTELTAQATVDYTVVGTQSYDNTGTITYVTGVEFTSAVPAFSTVRLEIAVASISDLGMGCVPVRTIADDQQFAVALNANTEPVYMSLETFKLTEQTKTSTNQYPLFNVYDPIVGDIVDANALFKFTESGSAAIDPNTGRRIVVTDSTNYSFTNLLIDSNNKLLAYRDTSIFNAYPVNNQTDIPAIWWYNNITNTLMAWDDQAWTSTFAVDAASTKLLIRNLTSTNSHPGIPTPTTSILIRTALVTTAQPTVYQAISQPLWYNPLTNQLQQYTANSWTPVSGVTIIVGADPSLRTVWRHGTNNEQYVPQFIDGNRNIVPVGSANGGWQVPDQWFYNPEHLNASEVTYTQLISHFGSISSAQAPIPGLLSAGVGVMAQSDFNYGLGGTIKEHNDGYDLLISAVNVTDTTPPQIVNFAQEEYLNNLRNVANTFIKNARVAFLDNSTAGITNLGGTVASLTIQQYQTDEYSSRIYADSTAYNHASGLGMQNWIATPAMFGFIGRTQPYINTLSTGYELVHHDGHRSSEGLSAAQEDQLIRSIIGVTDSRTNAPVGIVSSSTPPATATALQTAFNINAPLPGLYWYTVNSGTKTLYRFNVVYVGQSAPSSVGLPNGSLFYSLYTKTSYQLVNGTWTPITTVGAADVSPLWVAVDVNKIYVDTLLEVEQRLFDVSQLSANVDLFAAKTAEPTVFQSYMEQQFLVYTEAEQIITPLANTNYVSTNPWTWNYAASTVTVPPRSYTTTPSMAGCWQSLYTNWYGTPYPHREPWKLQGYTSKPSWWDAVYAGGSGVRVWQQQMWTNVFAGTIPAGYAYPNGNISTGNATTDGQSIPTYQYVSVNVADVAVLGYQPDDLLPPYVDVSSIVTTYPEVRSLMYLFASEIVAPQNDFTFGIGGPVEWQWMVSANYIYGLLTTNFLMQPVRFFHETFGNQYVEVDQLQVDINTGLVVNHTETAFHGEIYDTNKLYSIAGLNQWYIDYIRSTSQDAGRQFNTMWRSWTPTMTYRFGAIVDTSTVQVTNRNFDLTDKDYSIILSADGVIQELSADGFNVSVLATAPAITYRNNQDKWKLQVNALSSTSRSISYYGVQQYPFVVDTSTNTIRTQTYQIVGSSAVENRFYVQGDLTSIFTPGTSFNVFGTPSNNGTYTVTSSYYIPGSDQTRISVGQQVSLSAGVGSIQCPTRSISFATGDMVVFSGSGNLPAQLLPDTPYFIIAKLPNEYAIAQTYNDALAGTAITFTVAGSGEMYVGKVATSFKVLGGTSANTDLWYHYAIDTTTVNTVTLPVVVYGLQSLVNMFDGYNAIQTEAGFGYGVSAAALIDPTTGRTVDWQLETERFLDWAYVIRNTNIVITDKYTVNPTLSTNSLSFTDMVPSWADGTRVYITSTGQMPGGVISGISYYIKFIPGTESFRLYPSLDTTNTVQPVAITSVGSGNITASLPAAVTTGFPTFEVNPQRDIVWINTTSGVLANVVTGPGSEFSLSQLVFDQYGRPLRPDQFTVYRLDDHAKLVMQSSIPNDVTNTVDPYNYIHFGGGTFFLNGYEHYLTFANYTVGGDLIYDPFLGLQTQRFTLDFYREATPNYQPVMNGFFLSGQTMLRNIDGTISDLQNAYDVVNARENSPLTQYARAIAGYSGTQSYLDLLNVNEKAQFNFYRGMIKLKGSNNSITAYTNSRRFIDAQLDEYWAVKLGEIGNAAPKTYPEINLFSSDSLVNDLRLMFLDTNESTASANVVPYLTNDQFVPVSFADGSRWRNFPQQRDTLGSPLFLDGDFTSRVVMATTSIAPTEAQQIDHGIDMWFDGTNLWTHSGTGAHFAWSTEMAGKIHVSGTLAYFALDAIADDVVVIKRAFDAANDFSNFSPVYYPPGTVLGNVYQVNSGVIRFNKSDLTNGVFVIYTVGPSTDKINPAQLVDTAAGVVVNSLPLWDPARGIHYAPAARNLSYQVALDPAVYSSPVNPNNSTPYVWGANEVNRLWLDSSALGYVPYYDSSVFPNVTDRLVRWGQLAPWGAVNVYKWVQSTIPPQSWDAAVASQASDSSIPQSEKLTGTAKTSTYYRQRTPDTSVALVANGGTYSITTAVGYTKGDLVVVTSVGTMPAGLTPATTYEIYSVTPQNGQYLVTLYDMTLNQPVTVTQSGTIAFVPAFQASDWKRYDMIVEQHYPAMELSVPAVNPTLILTDSRWNSSLDTADVYVNGSLLSAAISLVNNTVSLTNYTANENDIVVIVRTPHVVTTAEAAFDPATYDDGSVLTQWSYLYDYSVSSTTYGSTTTATVATTFYYFWVQDTTDTPTGTSTQQVPLMSSSQVASTLETIPIPYFVVQLPELSNQLLAAFGYDNGPYGATFDSAISIEQFYESPVFYRQAIIRSIANEIDADNQYIIRFVRDLTLRTNMRSTLNGELKQQKHEKWLMIRRNQPNAIPRFLWTKLIESLVGYSLASGAPVPALDRVLYDDANNTSTQYGLGINQTMVNKSIGLTTVLSYLENTSNDFTPINIEEFLTANDFTTATGIITAMQAIYDTFPTEHVNSIWFETLLDGMTMQTQMKDVFKTSWVALHGVRILSVGGAFDD
jgi:hypothetical protein